MEAKPIEFHEKFISLALDEARKAELAGEVPVGAVVVKDGVVVATGHNRKESQNMATRHAEVEAIEKASTALGAWRLTDCDLYVTLEPCVMCAGAAISSRVRRIVYGAKDPKGGAVDSLYQIPSDQRLNHNCEVLGGVLEAPCSDILRQFFKAKREATKC